MTVTTRIRLFNFFRNIFKLPYLEKTLAGLTTGKGYQNFFVKCLPQNYQYKTGTFRTIKRNGIWFRLDISEYMEWVIYFGLNVEERQGLYPLIKKGMHIFDIGTNIGETLLSFAELTGQDGKVYGFEPVEENYNKCVSNISLNAFNNIQVSKLALSDKSETLYFGAAVNRNSGGIFMTREKQDASYSVQAMTLDDFMNVYQLSKADFIKIDVEGFEYNVLKGAAQTIKKCKPVLFIEIDERNLIRQSASPEIVFELMKSYGYSVEKAGGESLSGKAEGHYDIVCKPIVK